MLGKVVGHLRVVGTGNCNLKSDYLAILSTPVIRTVVADQASPPLRGNRISGQRNCGPENERIPTASPLSLSSCYVDLKVGASIKYVPKRKM